MQIVKYIRVMSRRKPEWFMVIAGVVIGLIASGGWMAEQALEEDDELQCECRSWGEIVQSDTLRVVTVSGSTTAFRHRNSWRGYEYELASQMARRLGLQLSIEMVTSQQAMLDSLRCGAADMAMYPMAYSVAAQDRCVQPCGQTYEVGQALISARKLPIGAQDSAKYTLAILSGSRQQVMVQQALDGDSAALWTEYFSLKPFTVDTLNADSINIEQLVDAVLAGTYDACLVETPLALLLKNFYPGIRVGNPLPDSEDSVAWMVSINADTLRHKIDSVMPVGRGIPHYPIMAKRYYEQSRGRRTVVRAFIGNGQLSVYDAYFRQYAHTIGWDWRLLAAVGFIESRFEPSVENNGAKGIMQLMARTAEQFGVSADMLEDPDANIMGGAYLLQYLENSLRRKIIATKFPETRNDKSLITDAMREEVNRDLVKFTLASYNAGMGHVYDAIALADTLGYDPAVWDHNVEHCLILKNDPKFYNLPCVRLGRFNGRFSCNYVRNVLDTYEDFREQTR